MPSLHLILLDSSAIDALPTGVQRALAQGEMDVTCHVGTGIPALAGAHVDHLLACATAVALIDAGRGFVTWEWPGGTSLEDHTGQPLALDLVVTDRANGNTTAAPEPATWAMMLLGFAGVGFMTHRRRSQSFALTVA